MTTTRPAVKNASDDSHVTRHVEPPAQGGQPYIRCTGCQREVLGQNAASIPHADDCPHVDASEEAA